MRGVESIRGLAFAAGLAVLGALALPACAAAAQEPGGPADRPGTRTCEDSAGCQEGEFCQKKTGKCDKRGKCAIRPEACTQIFDPVCGCDGMTYANECQAWAAGVSVEHEGECEPGPACTTNDDCSAGDYCAKAVGQCDGAGACEPRPEVCTEIFDPVCGCDGMTYTNSCKASSAGVTVHRAGECPAGG